MESILDDILNSVEERLCKDVLIDEKSSEDFLIYDSFWGSVSKIMQLMYSVAPASEVVTLLDGI